MPDAVELPLIYGQEHERRVMQLPSGEHVADPAVLAEIVHAPGNALCPDGSDEPGGFSRHNGGKHYVDSHRPDADHEQLGQNAAYETATPEVRSLRELRRYARAMDRAAVLAMQAFVQAHPEVAGLMYRHRATVGRENVYGTHLNYGVPHSIFEDLGYYSDRYGMSHFARSIASACFITGAGTLNAGGLVFSQKMDGLTGTQGRHGNRGTIFQLPNKPGERGRLQRVEVRLADTHPGDWENYMQAGVGGIALAVAQLPPNRLESRFGKLLPDNVLLLQMKTANAAKIEANGTLRTSRMLKAAVEWTLRLADTFLELPRQGIPGESDLVLVAEEALAFSELFRRAVPVCSDIHGFADRGATWAKRVLHVLEHAPPKRGVVDFTHPDCKAADDAYDAVQVSADAITYGPAFRPHPLPEDWRLTVSEIAAAMTEPPADTVAAYRTQLLRGVSDQEVAGINWSRVELGQSDGSVQVMYTNDPLAAAGPAP